MIRAYWAAKPKTKTAAAWKLLMRELNKINANTAQRCWKSSCCRPRPTAGRASPSGTTSSSASTRRTAQANHQSLSSKHPAHEVFRAEDLYAKPEWQTPAEAPF